MENKKSVIFLPVLFFYLSACGVSKTVAETLVETKTEQVEAEPEYGKMFSVNMVMNKGTDRNYIVMEGYYIRNERLKDGSEQQVIRGDKSLKVVFLDKEKKAVNEMLLPHPLFQNYEVPVGQGGELKSGEMEKQSAEFNFRFRRDKKIAFMAFFENINAQTNTLDTIYLPFN